MEYTWYIIYIYIYAHGLYIHIFIYIYIYIYIYIVCMDGICFVRHGCCAGSMTRVYYKDAAVALVVFDITRLETLENVRSGNAIWT